MMLGRSLGRRLFRFFSGFICVLASLPCVGTSLLSAPDTGVEVGSFGII